MILLIDNDPDTLEMTSLFFEHLGFEVKSSGQLIPLTDIIEVNPELVIVDYLLNGSFGSTLCTEIKQHPKTQHIPVVVFSALNSVEEIAKKSGADDFIYKPFDLKQFEQKIRRLL
ncbi:MAG TPA: response regulator [Chitinophagaceae bacterium]|jgi:DNA-binding response OmpR family regulator